MLAVKVCFLFASGLLLCLGFWFGCGWVYYVLVWIGKLWYGGCWLIVLGR